MDSAPRVGVPRHRESRVVVDDKALNGEDDKEHGETEEEKTKETGFIVDAVGSIEDLAKLAAIFFETIENET